jgi:hypothetical protein
VYSAKYHLIWYPKYRRRVLVGGVDERVKVIIGDVAAEVIEVEVMPDHVHLLAEVPPTVPLRGSLGWPRAGPPACSAWSAPVCGGCRCCGARRGLCPRIGGAPLAVVR